MKLPAIHRVVTGHDAHGKAIVSSNGPLPTVAEIKGVPGMVFHEVWNTLATRPLSTMAQTPSTGPLMLPPPKSGTR